MNRVQELAALEAEERKVMSRSRIVTNTENKLDSYGTGDNLRIELGLNVIAGPKDAMSRKATLVLTKEESFELAVDLLGQLPASWLVEHKQPLEKLLKVLKAGEVAEEKPVLNSEGRTVLPPLKK